MAKRKAASSRPRKAGAKKAAGTKTLRKGAARKKAARKRTAATRAGKASRRKVARRKVVAKARKSVARKAAPAARRRSKKSQKSASAKRAKKAARPRAVAKTARPAARPARPVRRPARDAAPVARKAPALSRARRTIQDDDLLPSPPSTLDLDRTASSARSGRRELKERFDEHTETGPAITGGDVDADWESAYTVGDEAPGGDSPTPDQDIVDDIGRAVGVEYQDNEELKGDEKIARRDRHRWELDPASSEDYDDR